MKLVSLAVLTLVLASVGCMQRLVGYRDVGPGGREAGMPTVSIDEFAQQQGISRQQARDYFQEAQKELTRVAPAK